MATVVIAMLGSGDEAEDVGQETFIRFYRSIDRFRGDAALKTYLTRIAINLSRNALRRRRSAPVVDEADTVIDGAAQLERRERQRQVRRAIDRLDSKHREVVVLRMIEGYSTKETAGILRIPQGTVLSRLSRAIRKLEAELVTESRPE